MTRYEIFYQGIANIEVDSGVQYFRYSDFTFLPQQTVANNAQAEKLISYISQSGKLPNGKYLFQFTINNGASEVLSILSKSVDVIVL